MNYISLSQTIEPHWFWDSFPLVSQSYQDGDEFQEFGLRWAGKGFTYASAPGWHFPNKPTLDDLEINDFAGVAEVIDLSENAKSGFIAAGDFTNKIGLGPLSKLIIIKTGHASSIPIRRREYFTQTPKLAPAIAEIAAERGVRNICVDFSCDSFNSKREDFTNGIFNPNSEFRDRAHQAGLVITENLCNLDQIKSKVFLLALPIKGEGMTTSPTRPVALTSWPSDNPSIYDVSTPLLNHWRWRMEIWREKGNYESGYLDQTQYIQSGHAFTHCDAPRHMEQTGPTIQELPNMGLDLFLGDASIIDISDIKLPSPVTAELLEQRSGGNIGKNKRIILRSDLTNRLGYKSTRWHTHAPNIEPSAADWLIEKQPAAICLDFPQDFIAREMPGRHVYNHEFEIHHKIFQAGIPFIEDLKDLGEVKNNNIFLAAVPLKMTCIDGAPMRAIIINW